MTLRITEITSKRIKSKLKMNYKKIIKSQQLRFKILRMLKWVPDSVMLRIQYRIKMGFWPNFKHPKRYTEKLQLYKMYYRNPVMAQCVDKYEVHDYVKNKGLSHILNKIYGVYENVNEIDFNTLPQQFVAKTTDGGGGQNIIIVKNKEEIDVREFTERLNSWLGKNNVNPGREWAYTGIGKSRIIIEKLLENQKKDGDLVDYKFLCFNGKVKCLWVDKGRYAEHRRGFWDENLNFLDISYGYPLLMETYLPDNIQEMIRIAEILSEDFPHARIDLYNLDGKIVFGEITFYCSSGYRKFTPDDFDFELGSYFTEY